MAHFHPALSLRRCSFFSPFHFRRCLFDVCSFFLSCCLSFSFFLLSFCFLSFLCVCLTSKVCDLYLFFCHHLSDLCTSLCSLLSVSTDWLFVTLTPPHPRLCVSLYLHGDLWWCVFSLWMTCKTSTWFSSVTCWPAWAHQGVSSL